MSHFKKYIVLGIVLLFPLVGGGLLLGHTPCQTTGEVTIDGKGTFNTIQAAINAAVPGETIELTTGTFCENIIIDKTITLQGAGMASTYIYGDCTTHVVWIKDTAPGVKIQELHVNVWGDTGSNYDGILIDSDNNVIENTIISECHRGIFIRSSGNTVRYNTICTIYDASFEGILIGETNNKIHDNVILRSEYPSGINTKGILLLSAEDCDIYHNHISNLEFGIYFAGGENNEISSNTIENNKKGFYLEASCGNRFIANTIKDSEEEGIYLKTGSNNNVFHWNNFITNGSHHAYIDNTVASYPCVGNEWYDVNTSLGNYWDNHTCVDNNADGICDNAYTIPSSNGAGDQDLYPLAPPWVTVCGNVDGSPDGQINQADIDHLARYVFAKYLPPVPLCAGDVNGDGDIDITDITILINYVHHGGPAPTGCPCN